MQKKINSISFYALLFCILSIFIVSLLESKWQHKGNEAVLSWDVTGYYLYLPAAFIYKDVRHLAFKDSIMKRYNPSTSFYQAFQLESGDWLLQYPIGLAVMYSPGFLMGHIGAMLGSYPQDGFSAPYQIGIWIWGLLVAFLGLLLLRKLLLNYFSDKAVALTLLVLALATNYMNYAAIDGAMTHNYEFTLYAAVLYFTRKWYLHPSFKISVIIGVLVGLAALARPTDIVIAIVPLAWGLVSLRSIKSTFQFLIKHLPQLAVAALVTLLVGSLQLLYWKMYSGDWLYYTYRDYGFSWRGQHLIDCFFSYKKGWLLYTPVMSFTLLGFWFLFRKWQNLFWFSFLFFIVNTYIIFSWDIWWYGGSFGQRAMVDSYAILALPLAAFIESIYKSFWKYVMIPIFLFCAGLNLLQIYQLHAEKGGLDPEFMTKEYYWRIFGKVGVPDEDRKLLDTDEDYTGDLQNVKVLLTEDFESFENDSTNVRPGGKDGSQKCMFLNFDFQESPIMEINASEIDGTWLRIKGNFLAEWMEWDMWKMSQLITTYYKGDKPVKERSIRIYRILKPEKDWMEISMDTKIPKESFDRVTFRVWHAGSRTHLWADNFVVESFDE
ncbi:MAG: hypothetical protein ACI8P3_000558 [Saprospiraceae bacterium]|jgi:hypothetical protein